MARLKPLLFALAATPALAQPAPQPFAPITIDAAKLAQIQAFERGLSMPADAHDALANLWRNLEQQAQADKGLADAHKESAK